MGKRKKAPVRGIVAWLITWEAVGSGAKAAVKDQVAAVLNPRLSGRRVAQIVELLYANSAYCPSERIQVAKNRKRCPYPVIFDRLSGIRWEGNMTCGHNPFLEARVVDDLHVVQDEKGDERFVWTERPRPDMSRFQLHS
jgi:hypothetical protein